MNHYIVVQIQTDVVPFGKITNIVTIQYITVLQSLL